MAPYIFLLTGFFLIPTAGFAQVEGEITDIQKKGISNALVIVTDSSRNFTDTARADKRGFYEFIGLKPGKYRLTASAPKFTTGVYDIIVDKDHTGAVKGEADLYKGIRLNIILRLDKTTRDP